jgi:Undecaprenyl-phosphate galactose phosphotransferase WbaP
MYPGYGLAHAEQLRRQTYAVLVTLAITAVFALAFQVGNLLSRLLLGLGLLGLLFFAPIMRYLVKRGLRKAKLWGKPIAVVGVGKPGAHLIRALQSEWGLGYKPVAVFDNRLVPARRMLEGVPYRGTLTDAMKLGQEQKVDTIIFALPDAPRDELIEFVRQASLSFPYATIVPNLAGVTTSAVVARDFAGTLGVEIKHNLLNPWAQRAKRVLDLLVGVVGGLFLSPLLLAIAALIKLDSPGPVFYGQQRLGGEGKHFRCWKFRTMHVDAESSLIHLLQSNAELRAEWERYQKLRNDPRITRMGRFLRKTSLDELPQLWNVLRKEMSLVGPRPIVDAEVSKYGDVYELYQRVKPGISGLWQVNGRSDMSYEERVATDAYYVRNWSVWLDLVILARTVGSIIFSRGAL